MNVLYLTHRLPYPPNKGEKIRTFHQIQQLAKNHTIHLCSFIDDPVDLLHIEALKEYCASVEVVYRSNALTVFLAFIAFLKHRPLSITLFYRKSLAEKVLRKLTTERLDCAIISCSSMAQYLSSDFGLPRVIDFIDVDSEKWRLYAQHRAFPISSVYRREADLLARYEEQTSRDFDHSILSSEAEAQLLRERVQDDRISVISNGVDVDYFRPSVVAPKVGAPPVIVFAGVMDYSPNVDAVQYFCRDIFPRVLNVVPKALFYIVGRNPTREVKQLGRSLHVIVTGTVPDVRPYLSQATVSVAPFRFARGIQNKVLEAMAMGVPVVGTPETFKGIAATEQDGIRIANDPASFAQYVTTFLNCHPTLRRESGGQARRYVECHHRWEDQGSKLERLLEKVVHSNAGARSPELKSVALT